MLNALAEQPQQTLSHLASSLDMTNSLTYRMLATLEAEEMILRDEHRRYSLGSRAMYLGYQAQRGLPISELAQPVMSRLAELTKETIHVVVRVGLERVVVGLKESVQPVRVATPIGAKFPMYYGGTGLCMFAYLKPEDQRLILSQGVNPKTPDTEIDPVKIMAIAATIKKQGYHVAVRDFADSAYSIAAPVFGADGVIVASICVVGPESRLSPETQARIVELVVEAGASLSAALGHTQQAGRVHVAV